MAIDRGRRPVVAMLGIGQSHAVAADVAELSACPTVESPPDAHGHAILQAYHGLAHVVHLVVVAHLAVLRQLLEEAGKGVERACQLMGVAPVVVLFPAGVPVECLVVVERVAAHDGNIGKAGVVLPQFPGHLHLLGGSGAFLYGPHIRLVEGRHAHDGMLGVGLHPMYVTIDHGRPMGRVGTFVGHVVFVSSSFLVGGEDERKRGTNGIEDVGSLAQDADDVGCQHGVVDQRLGETVGRAPYTHILLAHVIDAFLQILLVNPSLIKAPRGRKAMPLGGEGERNDDIGLVGRLEIDTRRRTSLVLGKNAIADRKSQQ